MPESFARVWRKEGHDCRYITQGVSGVLMLSPGFTCSPMCISDASISCAEWFPPLIIVLLA